jgi:short-subunit dehydrogenase
MTASKKTVLITGASSGIGAVYADRFAARGHGLILVARDADRLARTAQDLRSRHRIHADVLVADLMREEGLRAVEERIRADDRLGILVNNAGASLAGGFLDQAPEALSGLIALNVTAVTRLARAAAGRFAAESGGAIINVGSVVGLAPEYGLSVYGATKSFVLALTQALQAELGSSEIYLQAVLPSATRTEIWERSGRDVASLEAVMSPEDLVDAALVGFDRREAVSIPPLPDESQWETYERARQAMLGNFAQEAPAARYLAQIRG